MDIVGAVAFVVALYVVMARHTMQAWPKPWNLFRRTYRRGHLHSLAEDAASGRLTPKAAVDEYDRRVGAEAAAFLGHRDCPIDTMFNAEWRAVCALRGWQYRALRHTGS
jgi:hypothetical protein